MVERLMILRSDTFDDDNENQLSKNQSFNTEEDEDESSPLGDSPQQAENNSDTSKVDEPLLKNRLKPLLASMQSASVDTLNDQESLAGDLSVEKVKKKRRRPTEQGSVSIPKKSIDHSRIWLWLPKIDLTKPLLFLAIIFLAYIMWIKKDIWIPRLLTSTTRIRRTAILVEQQVKEKGDSPQISSSKNSSVSSANQEDSIDNEKNLNNNIINEQTSNLNDEDPPAPTPSTKSPTHTKLNVRTRRNKMSFSKDRPKKKDRRLHRRIIDDDDDDDDDDDNTDDIEVDNFETLNPTDAEEPILVSSIHSSKKHHHHHHNQQIIKIPKVAKKHAVLVAPDDIIQQLQKLVKSRGRHRDFVATFAKQTGLKKNKLNRFIQQKDFSVITLQTFISFLDLYDSTILIVSK